MTTLKVIQIKNSVPKALAYITRADATQDGLLVSTNAAVIDPSDWRALAKAFAHTADQGVTRDREGSVLAHHFIQSFDPTEKVSSELAHQLGDQLAQRISAGEFEYVVATHVDKDHVHNHILINATSYVHGRKFRMQRETLGQFRRVSDELSVEHGLRALPEPKQRAIRSMADLQLMMRGGAAKERLRVLIDNAAAASTSWEEFESRMMLAGVEVTRPRGARGSVTYGPEWMPWKVRDFRLGRAYTEAAVMARVAKQRVEPVTVDRSMFVSETGERLQVYVPGTRRALVLTVSWDNVVMHGRTARIYVATDGLHVLATPQGAYARTVTTRELYQWFQVPTADRAATEFELVAPIYNRVLTRRENRDQIRSILAQANATTRWGAGDEGVEKALARRDEAQGELAALVVAAADIMSTGGSQPELLTIQARARQLDTELQQLDVDVRALSSTPDPVSAGNSTTPTPRERRAMEIRNAAQARHRGDFEATQQSRRNDQVASQRENNEDQLDDAAKDRVTRMDDIRAAIRRDAAIDVETDTGRRTPPEEERSR